ncbi:MAG: 2-phospho-L-lactate guanylyltransferase [Chloroflexi bacterium]|nr:2-phospho-L-lactate guanylyltransferase [Chloroflexota bacterium]
MANWAIVPVKNLDISKSRLSDVLSADARRDLISSLLLSTLRTLNESELIENTIVISNDRSVLLLADKQAVFTVQEDSPSDLNSALHQATSVTLAHGATGLLVLPSDLPLLTIADVEKIVDADDSNRLVRIVPDQHGVGTNALFIRPPGVLRYKFGRDSLSSHKVEAKRIKAKLHVYRLSNVAFDIDDPDDLRRLQNVVLNTQ